MAKEKLYEKITNKHLKIVFGIIIILFSIYGLINFTIPSTAITYCFAFLFGNLYFLVYAFLIYIGLSLIFKSILKRVRFNFIFFGFLFLILSLLITLTLSATDASELNLGNFSTGFLSTIEFNGHNPVNVFDIENNIGGGYVGFLIVATLNSVFTSYIASIVFNCLLFVLSILFFLYYPLKELVVYLKNAQGTPRFKKAKKGISQLQEEKEIDELDLKTEDVNIDEPVLEETNTIKEIELDEELENNTSVDVEKPTLKTFSPIINSNNNSMSKPVFSDSFEIEEDENEFIDEGKINSNHNDETVIEYPNDEKEAELVTDDFDASNNYEMINEFDEETTENFEVENEIYEINQEKDEQISEESLDDNDVENVFIPETPPLINNTKEERIDNKVEIKEDVKPKITTTIYKAPNINLLKDSEIDEATILRNKEINDARLDSINEIFDQLGVGARATSYTIGPAVTRFDIVPNKEVSVGTIEKYVNDIASRLGGLSVRFEKIVLGKPTSALEIPNESSSIVYFKDVFLSMPTPKKNGDLFIPFGKNISGDFIFGDLSKFPHMLVSGASGSGKSIYIHSLIMSLIMRNSFDDLRLLLVDPKEVELSKYNGIPHLLGPVVSEAGKAKIALDRLVDEMENRYKILKESETSGIKEYNEYARMNNLPILPYIVAIIDEYADLNEVEKNIASPVTRLAQKARASGIHLIIATQRPSTNIITGVIKSNIPARAALMATSGVDSRVMLDQNGAENLVGNGDMLVQCQMISRNSLIRVQSPLLSSMEIRQVTNYLKENYGEKYDDNFTNLTIIDELNSMSSNNQFISNYSSDPLYEDVKEFAFSLETCSMSLIQRNFSVGFNRAGRLFKMLEDDGIVDASDKNSTKGKRVVIHSQPELDDYKAMFNGGKDDG